MDISFKLPLDAVRLYPGVENVFLRLVWVQQFKEEVGEPDLVPSDVFTAPFFTAIHADDSTMTSQLDWLNTELLSAPKKSQPIDYDIGKNEPWTGTVSVTPAPTFNIGIMGKRNRKFKVIKQHQIRFSGAPLDSRRLLSVNIDQKFYPAKGLMEIIGKRSDSSSTVEAQDIEMNPCFLWFIPSNATNVAATQAVPPIGAPLIWERLDIEAAFTEA